MPYNVTRVLLELRQLGGPEGTPIVPPISVSVVYRFTEAVEPATEEQKYGRENNPTTRVLERALAAAEEAGWCLAFNSGMAALSAVLHALAPHGARVVASRLLYGTTRGLLEALERRGLIELRYAGPPWGELLDEAGDADMVLVETIGNPTLRVPPLPELARRCGSGCRLVVDNTFASPVVYQPALLGENVIVVESLTKYIGGHNDVLGGVACGHHRGDYEMVWSERKTMGTILQPLDAFLAARGLKTLHLRVPWASRAAMRLAEALEQLEEVARVYYPGLPGHPDHGTARQLFQGGLYGGTLAAELRGGSEAARRMLRSLRVAAASPSLGGVETLVSYPYESSHRGLPEEEKRRLGITPGLVRISVGLEDPEDIVRDITGAIRAAHRGSSG